MFSKKTTVVTATKSSNTKSLFAGDKKVRIIIFTGVLMYILFVAGGLAVFWQYNNYKDQQAKNSMLSDDEWMPTEYSEMNEAQISAKLYKDTGKTPTNILDNKVDKNMLPTFAKAYSAAQAMYYLGHYDKALEAYALADTYKSKDKTYVFYLDYADAALTAEKYDIYYTQMDGAKSAIKDTKKLSNEAKDDLISTVDEKLTRIKAVQGR